MGQWTLLSAIPHFRERNDKYGHNFGIVFKLKYTPSFLGSFAEMPRLEWKETITMIQQNAGTWWQAIFDQYERLPSSPTFMNWVNRYKNAYYGVRDGNYDHPYDWSARIYKANGARFLRDDFPRLDTEKAKADYVRNYLKSHGGIMEINATDTPAIGKPNNDALVHKNRILTFDCGLRGSGTRVKLYQHLIVDGSKPESEWYRDFKVASVSPPFQTTGLEKVLPPDDVTKTGTFNGGAHNGSYL
jgi:hypothetical protein